MVPRFALIGLMAIAITGRAIAQDARPLIDADELAAAGFTKYWQAHLPLASGDTIENGYLLDEALYVTTDFGNVFALKADVGMLRWAVNLTEPDFLVLAPTHVQRADGAGPVVFPTSTATFVYDRFSGELLDRFTPEFATGSPAVAYDHYLFMGSTNGRFYSLAFNHPRLTRPMLRWEVMVRGPVTASPVLYDRRNLLIASQAGLVVSCRTENKEYNWSYETGGPILGDPVVDDTGVYIASLDRSLYKLNRNTGRRIWRTRFPRPLDTGPVVAGGLVYQYCPDHGLTAVDAATGQERWKHPTARTFAAHNAAGDVLFTLGRTLDVVDHDTGEVRSSLNANDVLKPVVNARTGAVLLLGNRGRVLSIQLDTVPYLRRQQIMAARKQLNQPPIDASNAVQPIKPPVPPVDPREGDPLRSRRDIKPPDGS